MQKTIKEICSILILATITAFAVNQFSPVGLPLMGQWDESEGVVRADPKAAAAWIGREIEAVEVAKQYYDRGEVVFIDARSADDYSKGHVTGAISLPVGEFDEHINAFLDQYSPQQAMIIYCTGRSCQDSHHVAEMMMDFGYEKVSVMIDGFPGWEAKGYPVE